MQRARDAGFDNLSIDLIYGISERTWATDLAKAIALDVPHLSAYNLTIEPDTAFGRWAAKGRFTPVDEDLSATQFTELTSAIARGVCSLRNLKLCQATWIDDSFCPAQYGLLAAKTLSRHWPVGAFLQRRQPAA